MKCDGRNKFSNHNVVLTFLVTGLENCAQNIWSGTALVAYLYAKSNGRNSSVGNVDAVWGMATLLAALPIGYLADKYSRDAVCKLGGVCYIFAVVATLYVVANDMSLYYMWFIMGLWGISSGKNPTHPPIHPPTRLNLTPRQP